MIGKLLRKVEFLSLQARVGSFDQFKKIAKLDQLDSKIIKQNTEILRPHYEYYIKEVSRADMAASLELATFIYTLCQLNHYTKILDMGSGLSSFVLRLYAKENHGVRIFSVDDDSDWLEKTKEFLKMHQLNTDNVFTLDQFLKSTENEFDCILHDLNFVEVRINYIERMMEVTKSNGIVIFDDVHKPDYLFALLKKLQGGSSKVYNLKPITLDQYNRFALAVVKD